MARVVPEAACPPAGRLLRRGDGNAGRVQEPLPLRSPPAHRPDAASAPDLPFARGALSEAIIAALARPPGVCGAPRVEAEDALGDDDLHLALYCCYELHYRGFAGVDPAWEWDPHLLSVRQVLERRFESALREEVPPEPVSPDEVEEALREVVKQDSGPSLARYIERRAGLDHVCEFLIHRSAYQLKEADPHSWAVPRLTGRPKEALVEVQADEYGGGRPGRMHSTLFARAMRALGLDDRYGAYLDHIPGTTLATVNLMSFFGLHRRLRGAIVGHLAAFEMTSSEPNGRYARGLRRLGAGEDATEFFDEHVEADAVHEAVAAHDLAGGLARQEPELASDIVFGARSLVALEGRAATLMVEAWSAGRSSLRASIRLG
jgi:Iron-containing redox enzyme